MRFMVLIYSDEATEAKMSEDQWQALLSEHNAFGTRHGDRVLAGDALEPTRTARTLRRIRGEVTAVDGPFAETKEQLGGYYLLEADSMDEALEMARELPLADHSSIEVRPVMELA
ncbi:MAG: YciI family protein [Spirochaetota bacterium]